MLIHKTSRDKELAGLGDSGCGLNSLGGDASDREKRWG